MKDEKQRSALQLPQQRQRGRNIKYSEINVTRDIEDLYSENCKTLLRKNGEKQHLDK